MRRFKELVKGGDLLEVDGGDDRDDDRRGSE